MKNQAYKWISGIGMTLCAASFLTGCSDDNFSSPFTDGDEVMLNFAVADHAIVTTRADKDNDVNNITFLVYDAAGELKFKQDLPGETGNKFYKSVNLSAINTLSGNLTFYAVANAQDKLSSISTATAEGKKIETLQAITDGVNGSALSMSAIVECPVSSITQQTFILNRNSAKMTVGINPKAEIEPNFSIESFEVVNTLPTTVVTAAADNLWGTGALTDASANRGEVVYMAPKEDASDISVLIYASHNNEMGWYRTSLKGLNPDKPSETKEIKSILPNYYYQVLVNKVVGAGFATKEEAISSALPNMEVVIRDHAPAVYSLITTGTHTLGVPEKIEVENIAEETVSLLIKTVCMESGTCGVANPKVTVINGSDWISVEGDVVPGSGDEGNNVPAAPTEGKFWSQSLKIQPLVGGEYREGELEVRWENLTRRVKVAQSGKFNGTALGTFMLFATNNPTDGDKEWRYFEEFLKQYAVGVDKEAMCGVERTQGLHFPIGLEKSHTDTSKTTYKYTLSSIQQAYSGGSYEISLQPGSWFAGKLKVGSTALSSASPITGTFNGSAIEFSLDDSSWEYVAEPKALIIKVTKDSKVTTFTYDLYHTGFFYKPETKASLVKGSNLPDKYYYYEVIGANVNGQKKYWLDRNMGASAAGMYIEDASGANYMPGETAPFVDGSQGNLYAISSEAYNTLDAEIVPPGFRIPTISEFTTLTSATQFKTVGAMSPVNRKTYWTAHFEDNVSKRQIHFPKNRYVQPGGTKIGDGNAGYYWTRSEAVGTAGGEKGKWWQAMKIAGGSASPIISRAWENDATGSPTAMSVRAVRNISVEESLKTYKLQVTGYTNVYLYHIDANGARIPLNNWPGDQILPYNEAQNKIDYDFKAFVEYDNVFVILNKIDAKGNVIASWDARDGDSDNNPAVADPSTDGKLVKDSNGKTPWDNRFSVPGDFENSKFKKYVIYWNTSKIGSNYKAIYIDGVGTYEGKVYPSDARYSYYEYNTEATSIKVAPYNGASNWFYYVNSDSKTFWSLNSYATTSYFTIEGHENNSAVLKQTKP